MALYFSSSKIKNKDYKTRFKLKIPSRELKNFAKYVGFNHPRKQKYLKFFLNMNSREKKLIFLIINLVVI